MTNTITPDRLLDCLIVGGGPAGLTAAIYLGRFHMSVVVVDAGQSRASSIPMTRNHAGFPEGISGAALLARMQEQAFRYGAKLHAGRINTITRDGDHFLAKAGKRVLRARTVLLATGVTNRRPPLIDDRQHDRALAEGYLRYCPICDGYEATDQRIAVIGTGERGYKEAMFLRGYSAHITLISPTKGHHLAYEQRSMLADAGIVLAGPYREISFDPDCVRFTIGDQSVLFDTVYPALGSDSHSELAGQLGASRSDDGCLAVDPHQRTDVSGLYAAGDVVLGLDQISHAMGEGGVAATTVRNDLASRAPIWR